MRRLGLLCLAALLIASACSDVPAFSATPDEARTVETLFPLIEELHVDAYWVDDTCRYFHNPRGSFSNDTSPDGCFVSSEPDPQPFDAQANRDISRLIKAIRDTNAGVDYMAIEPARQGSGIGPGGTFGIGPCHNLVYDPGAVAFPGKRDDMDVAGDTRPVTPDWYETVSAC